MASDNDSKISVFKAIRDYHLTWLKRHTAAARSLGIIEVSILIMSVLVVTYPFYYSNVREGLAASGIMATLGIASLASGGLLGFLFALPRTSKSNETSFRVNDNLEQISDWLTKIIVGVGLTQLSIIPLKVQQAGEYFASMSQPVLPSAVTSSALVAFIILGFMYGYLWTRLVVSKEIKVADVAFSRTIEKVQSKAEAAFDDVEEKIRKLHEQTKSSNAEPTAPEENADKSKSSEKTPDDTDSVR